MERRRRRRVRPQRLQHPRRHPAPGARRSGGYAQTGTLHDPYTGQTIAFTRDPETSNDPRNLLAVGAQANFDKAFRDATAWLPPDAAFRCEFVARQVDVKTVYGLWLSKNQKRPMQGVLAGC